jgi:hypothetical protein
MCQGESHSMGYESETSEASESSDEYAWRLVAHPESILFIDSQLYLSFNNLCT